MQITIRICLLIASTWICALPPHSGPTEQGERKASDTASRAQTSKDSPTTSPSPVPSVTPKGDQNPAATPQPDNQKGRNGVHPVEPFTVGTAEDNPLSVSTVKDNWDKALVIGTVALVLVGAFGIKYAVKTLGEMQKTKSVMDRQLQYMATIERAWVMGDLGWYEKKGVNIEESTVKGAERTTVMMKLTCKNEGKSPAWIDHVYTRLEITAGGSLTDEIDRDNLGDNGRWGALSVGESRSQSVQFAAYAIRGTKDFLSAFVIIEYRDIFDIKRETFLGYSIDYHGNVYRQDGLPNRNRNT